MRYLHTMVRVSDLEQSLDFYCNKLGLVEAARWDNEAGRFTLVFLCAPEDLDTFNETKAPALELTYNWDESGYDGGRNFGHLAFRVDNIYETCQKLMDAGVTINRPPRCGHMRRGGRARAAGAARAPRRPGAGLPHRPLQAGGPEGAAFLSRRSAVSAPGPRTTG